jgi:midasin
MDDQGNWRAGEPGIEQAQGEKEAVEKVWAALAVSLPLLQDEVIPYVDYESAHSLANVEADENVCSMLKIRFLRLLCRHPLLQQGPPLPLAAADPSILAKSLLTLHTFLYRLPTLPASASWPLPRSLEEIMKTHPIRAIRLVAWRCVRAWLGLYAGTGEDLKKKWVLQRSTSDGGGAETEVDEIAPLPTYPSNLVDEYTQALGPDRGEEDLLPPGSFNSELVGGENSARLVQGGLEVLVRERGVDPWILPLVEDVRAKEVGRKREDLRYLSSKEEEGTTGRLEPSELGKTVAVIEGVVSFREGLVPSLPSTSNSNGQPVASVSATEATISSTTTIQEPEPFISTFSHSSLLRSLARQLSSRKPTLLTGSPSSGKQSSITHLWNVVHSAPTSTTNEKTEAAKKRGLVIINLADRSLDSKSLLGSLSSAPSSTSSSSSTAGAGEFTFVEGPLTRALRQGRWTLLLNIDQAAPELLAVIKIVAERMHASSINQGRGGIGAEEQDGGVGVRLGDGKWVKAREGFMLFATRSVPIHSITVNEQDKQVQVPPSTFFASHFFDEVVLSPLSNEEVGQIVKGRYPRLDKVGSLRETLVGAWEKVREVSTRQTGTKEVGGSKRDVGVRDLLR